MPTEILYPSLVDAIKDTLQIIPFLIGIFYIIEIVEYFYSDKISAFSKFSKKLGPLLGSVFASIPQCGLSVVASTLYCKRLITKGTLIGVYLATSDEAIPVLIANPNGYKALLPLVTIKIFIGILAGYLIDLIFPTTLRQAQEGEEAHIHIEKGCHSHTFLRQDKKELLFHPFIHTLSVSFFIFIVTLLINILLSGFDLTNYALLQNKFIQPVITAFVGLIPNCAISVGVTVLYMKSVISFAACVSGLCSSAGLGVLVLVKNNESKRDTFSILLITLLISILAGLLCALI